MSDSIANGKKELAVEMNGVWLRYGETEVLKDVSVKIEEGEFLGLIGPNGGGKKRGNHNGFKHGREDNILESAHGAHKAKPR